MVPEGFQKLIGLIGAGRHEATVREVADLLEPDSELGVLGQIASLRATLDSVGVEVIPSLDKGELDTIRIFRFKPAGVDDVQGLVSALLADEESQCVEFKSTFRIDLKRLAQPGQTLDQCKSEEILHASLKTIAAFLNSDGGRLLIGVDDNKNVLGLDNDFGLTDSSNCDRFEIVFRNCLTGKFKDGGLINDFVTIKFATVEDNHVALVEVAPRRPLSFVKKGDAFLLYRRQGNRTTLVDISEMEEFLRTRWRLE